MIELNKLEKSLIEKEIQNLENKDIDKSKEKLLVAKAKLEAIDTKFYHKI